MDSTIQKNVSLAAHTTLKVGGAADYFVRVTTVEELKQAVTFAQQKALPVFLLGGGSNVLFADDGFRGLVIQNAIAGISYVEEAGAVALVCGAGEMWDSLVADAVSKEYWGLENLSAIPGTVGATPYQNVGAYGVEVSSLITHVGCLHVDTLEEKIFSNQACAFGYRDSYFKTAAGKKWIITQVHFQLSVVAKPVLEYKDVAHLQTRKNLTAQAVRDEIISIRSQKFPDWDTVGTAGSFFKNPIISDAQYTALKETYPELPAFAASSGEWKVSLGWILDKALHLKGYCEQDVCLYEKQALVLVNYGHSSTHIKSFYQAIQKRVHAEMGIVIKPEVQVVENNFK